MGQGDRLTQEYRSKVIERQIAVAFELDTEGKLRSSETVARYGGVYSFVPLGEAKSGAKFAIQADFLVQPGRDAINSPNCLLSQLALRAANVGNTNASSVFAVGNDSK